MFTEPTTRVIRTTRSRVITPKKREPGRPVTSKNPPKKGDKVYIQYEGTISLDGPYTVRSVLHFDEVKAARIEFSDRLYGDWYIYEQEAESRCWMAEEAQPRVPTAPMTKRVLNLLQLKGSATALEAQGVLKCRSLSRRICDLIELGWDIRKELKNDPGDGQRYVRYHLMPSV